MTRVRGPRVDSDIGQSCCARRTICACSALLSPAHVRRVARRFAAIESVRVQRYEECVYAGVCLEHGTQLGILGECVVGSGGHRVAVAGWLQRITTQLWAHIERGCVIERYSVLQVFIGQLRPITFTCRELRTGRARSGSLCHTTQAAASKQESPETRLNWPEFTTHNDAAPDQRWIVNRPFSDFGYTKF